MFHQFLHEGRNRLCDKSLPLREIDDLPGVQVHPHPISVLDPSPSIRRLKEGQPLIEPVSVKDARKALCDDAGDPRLLERDGCMFP